LAVAKPCVEKSAKSEFMSLKTLFITKNVPYPPIGGVGLRNWQNMNIMMKWGPVAVFSASNWTPNYTSAPGITVWKHCNVAKQRSRRELLERRFWWFYPHRHPDADWAYSHQAARELDELLTEFQPDLAIFEEVWLYPYLNIVQRHQCRIICDEHNVEAELFEQKNNSLQSLKLKLRAKLHASKLQSIERDWIQKADRIWVCSNEDTKLLQQLYGQSADSDVVPNGVNVAYYNSVRLGECSPPEELAEKHRNLLFLGQLSYSPNTIAVQLLIDQIYPQLKKINPEYRLLLVGRNPTPAMLKAAQQDPGIIVTGSVNDVRPYLAAATLMIVPLLQGGGTRLKILEAFASGCPVISTAKGAEGLNIKDGEHLLIRNSIEEMVTGVGELWSKPSLRRQLSQAAYELVKTEYSWEAVSQRVEVAIQELL
jgi:glycosyltransferase involved in cell wall biosynthesis